MKHAIPGNKLLVNHKSHIFMCITMTISNKVVNEDN